MIIKVLTFEFKRNREEKCEKTGLKKKLNNLQGQNYEK